MPTATRHHRRNKKRNPNWPLRWIVLGVLVSFLIAALVIPALRFRNDRFAYENGRWDVFTEAMLTNIMGWFVGVWMFFFGACLGSFLNVVAYRLPNRLTLFGSSRCPYCFVPIEARHNIPIIGWFSLRGRCAACRLPISPRYFVVEIIAGLLLLWLFVVELATDGANLPGNQDYQIAYLFRTLASGKFEDLFLQDWSLVRIFLVHCVIGYTLLTAALMKLDRLTIPLYWQLTHLLVVFFVVALWPQDFSINSWSAQRGEWMSGWISRIDMQLIGGIAGLLWGRSLPRTGEGGLGFVYCLLGIGLGLPAMISIGLLSTILWGLATLFRLRRRARSVPMFVVLLAFAIQVMIWRNLENIWFWPSGNSPILSLALAAAAGSLLTNLLLRWNAVSESFPIAPATEKSISNPDHGELDDTMCLESTATIAEDLEDPGPDANATKLD